MCICKPKEAAGEHFPSRWRCTLCQGRAGFLRWRKNKCIKRPQGTRPAKEAPAECVQGRFHTSTRRFEARDVNSDEHICLGDNGNPDLESVYDTAFELLLVGFSCMRSNTIEQTFWRTEVRASETLLLF